MKKVEKSIIVSVLVVTILMAGGVDAHAETIFETFDTDPTDGGNWTCNTQGGSDFSYNEIGYLDVTIERHTEYVDRYITTLSQTYDKTQEFWWEVDMQVLTSSPSAMKEGLVGVFNSANDNMHNSIGFGFCWRENNNRNDVQAYMDSGKVKYCAGPYTEDEAYLRFKGHYWPDSDGYGHARMDVYDIPSGTLVGTVESCTLVSSTDSLSFNLFGLGNLHYAYTGGIIAKIDNLYFSTEQANPSSVKPSFYSEVEVNDVFAITSLDSLNVNTVLNNITDSSQSVYIRHRVYEDEDVSNPPYIEATSPLLTVPANGECSWQKVWSDLSPNIWSPASPKVYLLRTEVLDSSMNLMTRRDNIIGFRTFEIDGKNFKLNGKPIYLTGISRLPPGLIPPDMYTDPNFIAQHIARLKQKNVNFVRLPEGAENDAWYEACDRAGIMGFAGCYSGGGSTDPNQYYYNLQVLQEAIPRLKNHPCVVMWVTGAEWVLDAPGMRQAAEDLYNAVKAMDPTRPVFQSWAGRYYTGGNISQNIGSDFLSYHDYTGYYAGSVYSFYDFHTSELYPVIVNECVGAYTNVDPGDGGFRVQLDKILANALRTVGHSYQYGQDSLWYQAYLARELTEILRRSRGTTSSMCGATPFTDAYFYDYDNGTETAKPIIDELGKSYEPVHISIECLKPNIYAGGTVITTMHILNDDPNYDPCLPTTTLYLSLIHI